MRLQVLALLMPERDEFFEIVQVRPIHSPGGSDAGLQKALAPGFWDAVFAHGLEAS